MKTFANARNDNQVCLFYTNGKYLLWVEVIVVIFLDTHISKFYH